MDWLSVIVCSLAGATGFARASDTTIFFYRQRQDTAAVSGKRNKSQSALPSGAVLA
jgi:hypothetical protein